MRVTKLVIGILMIVYSVWLFIQGLLGGFLGIIAEKNMVAGIIGVLLAVCLWLAVLFMFQLKIVMG